MKLFYILPLIALFACSCSENTSQPATIINKDSLAEDLRAKGLEDLSGSQQMKDIICQNWDYAEDAEEAGLEDPSSMLDIVFRGYCIFSDGSLVKDPRGSMLAGKWTIDDISKPIILSFTFTNGDKESWQLAYLSPERMKLAGRGENVNSIIELTSGSYRHINHREAPFHISNNSWRFKPVKPETDEQVKQRLKSGIRFFILFYNEQINSGTDKVLFTGLPSCFKWYGGAIYLQKVKELDDKWVNCFYNREQAMKAYQVADKLLSKKYNWLKNESNWLKLNMDVLKQMENRIDSIQ